MTPRQRLVFAAGIGALLVVLATAQWRIRLDPSDPLPTVVLLVAALLAALAVSGPDESAAAASLPAAATRPRARVLSRLGYAGIVAGSVLLSVRWHRSFFTGATVLVVGVTLLSIGLSRFDTPTRPSTPVAMHWSTAEAATLLGIVALAFALRFYRFTEFPDPYGIFAIEEPQTGMGGYLILHGQRPWEFLLDHYLAALALRLGGPSLSAVRVPFAIFSALTVVPMYLLLRQLVRKPAALFGTFLLAVSSWHLIYARCAHNIFLTTFFVVALLALLVAAERTHRLALFPWIGFLSGYTLYTYAGYRGTVAFVVLFLGIAMVRHLLGLRRHHEPEGRAIHVRLARRDLHGLGIVSFVVAALIPPIIVQVAHDPRQVSYFEAAGRATADSDYYTSDLREFAQQRIDRARDAAAIFLHHGDRSPTFNYPGVPMLDPVTGTLFVVGLVYAVCFPWRGHNAFFLTVFLVLFIGGTIFVHNLDVRRLQGIIPLIVLFATLWVDRLLGYAQRLGSAAVGVFYCVAAVAALYAAAWSYHLFFTKMAHSSRVHAAFHNEYTELIRLGKEQAAGHYLVVVTDRTNFFAPSDYFWLIQGRIKGQALRDLTLILPPQGLPPVPEPVSVVIQRPYEGAAIAALLRTVYPNGTCRDDVDPHARHWRMTVCDFPVGTTPRDSQEVSTLSARYFLRPPPEGAPAVQRREPFISYALVPSICRRRKVSPQDNECYAEWTGSFELASDTTVSFQPRSRAGSLSVFVDGQPAGAAMRLARGPHQLLATAHFPRQEETGVHLNWRLLGAASTLMPFYRVQP